MTRRRRLLLIVLVVVLGFPALLIAGFAYLVQSGQIERRIAAGWTAQGLPGRLEIGRFELLTSSTAVLHGVTLRDGLLASPLATAERCEVRFDWRKRDINSLRFTGVKGTIDRARWEFLLAVIRAADDIPPSPHPTPIHIDAQGDVDFAGVPLERVVVGVDAIGPEATVEASAEAAGRPLRFSLTSGRSKDAEGRGRGPVRIAMRFSAVAAPLAPLLDAWVAVGELKPLPAAVRPWLPAVVDGAGSTLDVDPGARRWTGNLQLRWAEGEAVTALEADPKRLRLAGLRLRDQGLGEYDGGLAADFGAATLALDCPRWRPGPRLPVPPQVAPAPILAVLPGLRVSGPENGDRWRIALLGAGDTAQARAELLIADGGLRLDGSELPLVLAQPFVPCTIAGGHATRFSLSADRDRVRDVSATLRQARLSLAGWSLGPIDGQIAIVPTAEGASITLGTAAGRVALAASASRSEIVLELEAAEALLARLRGPTALPDLRGQVRGTVVVQQADGGWAVRSEKLKLAGAAIGDLVRNLDAELKSAVTWKDGTLAILGGGHLTRGDLHLPGAWLDIASRTPIFTIAAGLPAVERGPRVLQLRELLVRAADARGDPVERGWSAQFSGQLSADDGAGSLRGVIDHADLGWIAQQVTLPEGKLAGEGALVFTIALASGAIQKLEGDFLPLSADLDLGSAIRVQGIKGRVRVVLDLSSQPAASATGDGAR